MKNIKNVLLIIGLILLNSCGSGQKNLIENETQAELQIDENSDFENNQDLIVGFWKDTSPSALHFTLFADGTARSDNMNTLLYKNWRINGNKIIFTVESIGNHTSSVNEEIYEIQKLDEEELILSKKNQLYKYRKSEKKNSDNEKSVMVDTDEINQILTKNNESLSAQEVMKLYYPIKVITGEGNEKIEISEKIAGDGNTLLTLIHDNLLDDSIKGEKHIMELKLTNGKWTVLSVKKNWKCRNNRGHNSWGIGMCK